MQTAVKKLSVGEKIGYSLGDGAANFVFQTIMMFQVVYFVGIFGIPEKKASVLFLVALFWNGIFDFIMGAIADKTNTRWGKFRPWILWSAVPFGIIFYLTYMAPDIAENLKLVYAYATYTLMMTIYSVNNTPYSALGGVMTGDTVERTNIASYRQVTAMAAAFVIQGFFLSIKNFFANGDEVHGWRVTIAIFAVLAMIFHLITFLSARERIVPKKEEESNLKEALGDLSRNGPWIVLFLATLFIFTNLSLRGNMLYFYFTRYINPEPLQSFLSSLGYGALENAGEKGFELFNMTGMAFTILGIIVSKPLSVRFGKRNVFLTGLILATFFCALLVVVSRTNPVWAYVINISQTFFYGTTIPLLWSMLGDVADYSAWKLNRRSTGIVFAGAGLALKVGLGIGIALAPLLLSIYGFDTAIINPDPSREDAAIEAVHLGASIYPAIMFVIAVICLFFYRIDTKMELKIQDELEARREKS
jgi:sugar (glycoside-pentoside-hexuronide) transporter